MKSKIEIERETDVEKSFDDREKNRSGDCDEDEDQDRRRTIVQRHETKDQSVDGDEVNDRDGETETKTMIKKMIEAKTETAMKFV